MKNSLFTHLHIHNEYSFLDGFGTAEAYVEYAKELGFKSLALTNHGDISGLINFQRACEKKNIKPTNSSSYTILPGRMAAVIV